MYRLRVCIVFLFITISFCSAQFNHFTYLTAKDGLSDGSINAFYEDEYARMWIATRNGLNCYDSHSFRVWNTGNGLNDTYIRNVVGDHNGNILIQTRTTIFLLDLRSEQLRPIHHIKNETTIAGNENGLWLVSADTLFSVEISDTVILRPCITAKSIHAVLAPDKNHLWVASSEGVRLYKDRLPTTLFAHIQHVSQIYEDNAHNLWICTRESGLYQCSYTQFLNHYTHDKETLNSLTDNDVRCISEDKSGFLWIGLYGGLCRLDPQTDVITRYEYAPRADHSLSTFAIWALTTDCQGTVWIGTFFGGIALINPHRSPYTYLGAFGRDGYRLSNPIATCACVDNHRNIWIGTNGGGVNYLNRTTNLIDYKSLNIHNPQYAVKSMWFDVDNERLWIGTHRGGLKWLNTNNPSEPVHTVSLPEDNIRQVIPMHDSLCVMTQHNLYLISPKTGQYRPLIPQDIMPVIKGELSDMALYEGMVWFARANSLYAYPYGSSNARTVLHYELPTNVVTLFADSLNGLLIGTDSYGVMQKKDDYFVPVAKLNEKMAASYITDIQSNGLYYLFATTHAIYLSNLLFENIRSVSPSESFPLESVVEHSCSFIGDEIYAGGVNGIAIFSLKEHDASIAPHSIILSRLSVDNIPSQQVLLTDSVITLQPDFQILSFDVTATGFITRNNCELRYRLRNYSKNWINAENNATISYSNLPKGTYSFEVECVGTSLTRCITIRVLPHWYESWWAWVLYLLAGGGLLIWGAIWFKRYIENRTKRQLMSGYQQELLKATNIVMNHLADSEFNVERFAREMLLSRTRLFEKIQQIAGQTPNEFILGIRMREAANMLRTKPDLSILDVSILVGFNSCSYFTKCFHHHFGVSPTTWRKSGK